MEEKLVITGVGSSTTGVLEVEGAGAAGGVEVTTDEVEGVSTGAAGGVEVSSGAADEEGVSAGTEVSAGGGDWASDVVMVTVGRAEVTLTVTVLTLVEETVVTASGSVEEVVAGRGTTDVR